MQLEPYEEKQLIKSENKWVTGTLGGIAEYLQIDPIVTRVIYALGLSVGPFQFELLVTYLLLAIVIPSEKNYYNY